MDVTPGEPVPPGFEDEVSRMAEIQKLIEAYKGNALIGLEYAIELRESGKEREPYYMCVLCDKRCDPRTIMQHWTSHGHRLNYLDKHFPTAMRELEPIRNKNDKMKVMVQVLVEAIERHHGRAQLSVYSTDEFRRSKAKVFDEVKAKFHFDERGGPNFVNVIDRSLLSATGHQKGDKGEKSSGGKTEELDEISSDSDAGQAGSKKLRQQGKQPTIRLLPGKRGNDSAPAAAAAPPAEAKIEEKPKPKFPTPKELSLQASHIAQERYKWEKYRCMLEIYLKQMEKTHKEYEKNPEKHPLYPEEWKAFWNRRYKELQKEKKVDPNKYDYRPEWALYWSKKRKELFDIEIEKKKKEIKAKLELPEDAEEVLDRLKEKYKVQATRPAAAAAGAAKEHSNGTDAEPKNGGKRDATVIDISDDDQPPSKSPRASNSSRSKARPPRHSRSISPRPRSDHRRHHNPRRRSKSRTMSPFSEEYDEYEGRQVMRDKLMPGRGGMPPASLSSFSSRRYPPVEMSYRQEIPHPYYNKHPHYGGAPHYRGGKEPSFPMHAQYDDSLDSPPPSVPKQKPKQKEIEPEPEEEGPLTVVAVLRLLTALEDILGSLGPKTVDLLGKALALDNVKANSADDLLLNEDNCVFFETAKEKLKGLLIAGVVEDPQKVRAVKKAIRNIAAIIHQVTTRGKSADKKEEAAKAGASTTTDASTNGGKVNQAVNIKALPFDRQLVASKLASELVKQGREDLSTADMDKLIYFFILMVKLSKDKFEFDEKPLYMKDIAKELGIHVPLPISLPIVVAEALASKPSTSTNFPAKPSRQNFASFVENLLEEEGLENEVSNDRSEKSTKNDTGGGSSLESLTDSDLQTLLQNFKHLSTEEQHHLIAHLKKLETSDPARVEKLRKFVNVGDEGEAAGGGDDTMHSERSSGQRGGRNDASVSSVSSNRASNSRLRQESSPRRSMSRDRANGGAFSDDEFDGIDHRERERERGSKVVNPNKFSLDDEDDDDYNFDDVLKAASSIVDNSARQSSSSKSKAGDPPAPGTSSKDPLTFNRAAMASSSSSSSKITLSETQNLIANLMGNLQQNNSSKKPEPHPQQQQVQPVQSIAPYYQSYDQQQQQHPQQQHHPQQQPHPQQQFPPQQAFPQQFPQQQPQQQAPFVQNNQMGYNSMGGGGGYMGGNDPNAYYGYNNAYQGYPQQAQQQWGGGGYNMYGGN